MHKSLVGTSEILQLMLTYTPKLHVVWWGVRLYHPVHKYCNGNLSPFQWGIDASTNGGCSFPCQAVFCSSVAIDWKIWRAAAHTTVAQKHLWHLSDGPSTARPNPWSLDLRKQFRPQDRAKEPFANWKWQNTISRNNPVKISIILHSVQMMSLEIKRLWGERSSKTMRNCPNRTR